MGTTAPATTTAAGGESNAKGAKALPPVLGHLFRGTFWLALRSPLQAVFALWSVPLILDTLDKGPNGAYTFALSFGFLQFLLEFGMSSALQRQVSTAWTRDDRPAVDRAIACGLWFYGATALVQAAVLIAYAYWGLPQTDWDGPEARLIVKMLWLQAVTAPCFGLSAVVSSILQAARRYDFIPRFELAGIILRFTILLTCLRLGVDFFAVIVVITLTQTLITLGPALWVMVRELHYVPRPFQARLGDLAILGQVSVYVFMIQLSVALADKLDTIVLTYTLADPGPATTIYNNVSKPFTQIRQTGWMLSYLVMPAVASLAAARDDRALDRIKYDAPRLLVGALLPVALLAWIYAGPFLATWVGLEYGGPEVAGLLRLFLVATLPLVISVHVQMAIGMGHIRLIALAALLGALINLPISYYLTLRIGVAGVIWGTVLTTLFSNLLVPGWHAFRVLDVRPWTFARRTLGPPLLGAFCLILATWAARLAFGDPYPIARGPAHAGPLVVHLAIGSLAFMLGYLASPPGRADVSEILRKARRRRAAPIAPVEESPPPVAG